MSEGQSKQSFKELLNAKVPRLSDLLLAAKNAFSKVKLLEGNTSGSHDLAGLVFGSYYIKLLKITPHQHNYTVESFNITKLPPGLIKKHQISDKNILADILKKIVKDIGLKTNNIALTIPRSFGIIKNIMVSKQLRADEIESRVWVEASRLFPNLVNDIYLDYSITGTSEQDSNLWDVILVACRKEQIQPYLEVIEMAGLTPKVVDVNSYALERALSIVTSHVPQLKTVALLNINFNLIDLLVIHEGKLIYTHELSYDGLFLRNLIATPENLDEQIKKELDANLSVNEILRTHLGLHLRHTMQFFYSSKPSIRIERVYLGGDCAALIPGIAPFIQEEIGKEVAIADPFKDMQLDSSVDQDKLKLFSPSLMLCCGIALSKLN